MESSALSRIYQLAPRVFGAGFAVAVPKPDREFILTPRFLAQRFGPEQFAALSAGGDTPAVTFEVTDVVHVQAGWVGDRWVSVEETRWVDALPFLRPRLAGIVAHLDPRWPDARDILDAHLQASDRVVGVRSMAAWHPDRGVKRWEQDPHTYQSSAFLNGFEVVADAGLSFDAWVFADQLDDVAVLADTFPHTPIVVDHAGTPVGVAGARGRSTARTVTERADLRRRWLHQLAALADRPNVSVKLSGFAMPILGYNEPATREQLWQVWGPALSEIITMFGADRVMFGSNSPIDAAVATYHDLSSVGFGRG